MAKNHMKEFARILGLKIEEEFKIKDIDCNFKITFDGLKSNITGKWVSANYWYLHAL